MFLLLFVMLHIPSLFRSAKGIDPFEGGGLKFNCLKPRLTGCVNGSLSAFCVSVNCTLPPKEGNSPDTEAYLFTRDNQQCPEFLHLCSNKLPDNTNFRPGSQTIIVIGGFMCDICSVAIFREIKDQLLCRGDFNVILINWPWGFGPDLATAINNTKIVGQQVACLILFIAKKYNLAGDRFYCIGHSLGAHAAGFAGNFYKQCSGGDKIGRITGLDPAGATFVDADPSERLDPSDAKLVDVIHTSASRCLETGFGTPTLSGHADFFPNGGSIQLNCYCALLPAIAKLDLYYAVLIITPVICFHMQALKYYLASINPCKCWFIGKECNSYADFLSGNCNTNLGANESRYAVMGFDFVPWQRNIQNTSVKYYFNSISCCPYCDTYDTSLQGLGYQPMPPSQTPYCFPECRTLTKPYSSGC